ncbi:MAG TPA: DUF1634 domain-containing protein [Phycisphaerales bacterium]|nr:DUF1634 domain-containing protein [Phycisphaerales bacterium]
MGEEHNGPGHGNIPTHTEEPGLSHARILELRLARVLVYGITTCAVILLISLIATLLRDGGKSVSFREFHPERSSTSMREVLDGVQAMEPRAWLMLGVLLVILTPVARVTFSLAAFAKERDRLYVFITLIVLTILAYSFFFGKV